VNLDIIRVSSRADSKRRARETEYAIVPPFIAQPECCWNNKVVNAAERRRLLRLSYANCAIEISGLNLTRIIIDADACVLVHRISDAAFDA